MTVERDRLYELHLMELGKRMKALNADEVAVVLRTCATSQLIAELERRDEAMNRWLENMTEKLQEQRVDTCSDLTEKEKLYKELRRTFRT